MPESADLIEILNRPVLDVAPRLLGGVLRHGEVAVRISEVEAYDGLDDPGSHAFRGQTARNATMFGPAAHLYVYFIYGLYHCCNVVVGPKGRPAAVLLRAGEVIAGHDLASERRNAPARHRDLARGPARLCSALGIDRAMDGHRLDMPPLTFELAPTSPAEVSRGPRVGLRHAAERPWRFWLPGDRTVSAYRPAAPPRGSRPRAAEQNLRAP